MKKKILFVLHIPPPVHGSSIVGEQIKNSQKINTAFDCDFINLSTSSSLKKIGTFSFYKIYLYFKVLQQIVLKNIKNKYNLIYIAPTISKSGFLKDFFVVLLLKILNKNILFHLHNKGVSDRNKAYFIDILYKVFFKDVKVILLSKYLYGDIKEFVKIKDTYVCPNGIDVIQDLETGLLVKKTNEIPTILFLSNLIESKGILVLLEACSILKERDVSFKCNVIGGEADIDAKTFEVIKIKLNVINEVNYLGKKYGKDKYDFFLNSDIFVFPTYYKKETFGLVLLEAMQFGLPIVTTNEGGIPDLVKDNVNGFIVEKKKPVELANKIQELINDKNKIKIFGNEGRRIFLDKFTTRSFETNLKMILEEVSE